MASCILPDWVRWASSTKTKRLPLALKSFGILAFSSAMKSASASSRSSSSSEPRNLWISEQISHGSSDLLRVARQVGAAGGAVDLLVDAVEDALDLLVEFGAVGDQQDPGVGLVLAEPLGQPDHRQGLARALGVPDDAALALGDPRLSGLDAEVLVVAAGLLDAGVEDHEVVDDLQQPLLRAQLRQRSIERLLDVGFLAPRQPVLLRRVDDAVAQALDVVAGHDELHGGEERTRMKSGF